MIDIPSQVVSVSKISSFVLAALLITGCHRIETDLSTDYLKQSEKRFVAYISGDAKAARASLIAEIHVFENSRSVAPQVQAAALFMACARLYVLEKRLDNKDAAEIAFVKTRYWNLRRYEISGPLIGDQLVEFKLFTPEKALEMIDRLDKSLSYGRGPSYTTNAVPSSLPTSQL